MNGEIIFVCMYYHFTASDIRRRITRDLFNDLIEELGRRFPDMVLSVNILPGKDHGMTRIRESFADLAEPLSEQEMYAMCGSREVCKEGTLSAGLYYDMNHVFIFLGNWDTAIMKRTMKILKDNRYECLYDMPVENEDIYPHTRAMTSRIAARTSRRTLEHARNALGKKGLIPDRKP